MTKARSDLLRMRSWLTRDRNRKDSDGFFLFLCNHTVNVHDNYLDILAKRRENVLTVMSFCFMGALTFVSAGFDSIVTRPVAAIFSLAFVALWLGSFLAVIIASMRNNYYKILPGKMDGISFSPSGGDCDAFRESKVEPFDADIFFMKKYLRELGCEKDDTDDYSSLLIEYQARIEGLSDVEDINRNAFLASLVHITIAQIRRVEKTLGVYRWSYFALWASLLFLFVAILACML